MKRARILTHRLDDGIWVIVVDGEYDIFNRRDLQIDLELIFAIGTRLVLDLSRATLIDSTVLRLLVCAHKRAERSSGAFAVVAPRHRAARRLLEITQAQAIFPTFTTRPQAIDWCRLPAHAAAPSHDAVPLARA
jgi:anti-anti-sigma factor